MTSSRLAAPGRSKTTLQGASPNSRRRVASSPKSQSCVPIMRHDCAFVSNSPRKYLIIGRTEAARNDGSDCIKSLSRKPRHDGRRDTFVEQ